MVDVWNDVEKDPFYSKIHGSRLATCNNVIKTAKKSKSCEKMNCFIGNRDTTNRGLHHGPTMVSSGSAFFYSSFFPRAWQLKGIQRESKYTRLVPKQGQKGSKSCKTQKRTIPEDNGKRTINYRIKHIIFLKNATKWP